MRKLVSIEKFEDGKTKITIVRMPKTTNHYKILLRRCGSTQHWVNVIMENTINSKSYYENTNDGMYWHIHLSSSDDNAKYEVVLDNSEWVSNHIKEITVQILHQEEQILVNRALKTQTKNITQAVRSNNYTSLIKQMIIDNADTFTLENLEELKSAIHQVEQQITYSNDIEQIKS
ncbi:MAG: hypothetical protein J6Q15_03320 [Clostridia bacterium]|nr:hypothetical protein [Clostridia bacterium]